MHANLTPNNQSVKNHKFFNNHIPLTGSFMKLSPEAILTTRTGAGGEFFSFRKPTEDRVEMYGEKIDIEDLDDR
jgi:hypothetical protein